jgi:hypothetical protein
MTSPLERLKHHVTGAIERGEKTAIEEMTVKPGTYVIDRSQRTGYRTIYTVRSIEGDRALVQRNGELVNGRIQYGSGRRDESYRDLSNLEPWTD